MLCPKLTALLTLVPEVAQETWVPPGLFLVTSVGLAVKLAVLQVTEALQVEAPIAIVQEVAEILPEGLGVTTQLVPFQLLPEAQATSMVED